MDFGLRHDCERIGFFLSRGAAADCLLGDDARAASRAAVSMVRSNNLKGRDAACEMLEYLLLVLE